MNLQYAIHTAALKPTVLKPKQAWFNLETADSLSESWPSGVSEESDQRIKIH